MEIQENENNLWFVFYVFKATLSVSYSIFQRFIKNSLPMWFDIKVAQVDPKSGNQPKLTIYIR
jgi:hypothetical protein